MLLRILAERKKLALANRQLRLRIRGGKPFTRPLGHQGGRGEYAIWWHARAGVWATQKRLENRFWTVFGVSDPKGKSQLGIAVEMNCPVRAIDRSVAGVFLEAERGRIYLGHRGNKINRVTKKEFRRRLRNEPHWRWTLATDGDRESEVIVLRHLQDPLLMTAIGAFAREVRRIKKVVR